MDINNDQQQNTFESGMNMDTADYVLAKNQYREARNLRLVTDSSGNSAELHFISGNAYRFNLPPNSHVLATDSIRDIGVVIVQDESAWNILVIKELGDTVDANTIFTGGISELLDETYPIDTLMRYESDDNIKLYIADSTHPLIAVNVASVGQKDVSIEDIVAYPQSELAAPKFAGFVDGTLTAGLYQYAYRLYNKRGNASEISKTTKLIPIVKAGSGGTYYGYEKGTSTSLGIAIQIPLDNNKLSRMYVYRICYTEVGQLPTIELIKDANVSGVTEYTVNDTGGTGLSTLTLEEFNSVSGVHIIPKTIESKNDYLFAAGIKQQDSEIDISTYDARTYSYYYDEAAATFKVKIDGEILPGSSIKKDEVSGAIAYFNKIRSRITYYTSFVKDDTADCMQDSDAKYVPWVYEKYNKTAQQTTLDWVPLYGGIGNNIRWRFVVGQLDADYTQCCDAGSTLIDLIRNIDKAQIYECVGPTSYLWKAISTLDDSSYTTTEDYQLDQTKFLQFGSIDGLIRKKELSGSRLQKGISLGGVKLKFKDESATITGVEYFSDDLLASTCWENDYVVDFAGNGNTEKGIDLNECNYANPKVSYLYKSLRRGETYRFGIIFYDRFGRNTKVKWIQDVVVPELYEPGFETFVSDETSYGNAGRIDLAVRPLGIQFDVMNLPSGAVGYEIVRCNRTSANIKNLAQGVLSKPVRRHQWLESDISSQVYCPTGYLTTGRFLQGNNNFYWARCYHDTDDTNSWRHNADNFDNFDTYQFVSAETTYQPTSTYQLLDNIGRNNLKLQGLKYLFAQSQTQPLYFAKDSLVNKQDSETTKYFYTYGAHVMELGHYNSMLYLPHVARGKIDVTYSSAKGDDYTISYNIDPEAHQCDGYERSLMWLGLDVICNMFGALQSSHRPFWRDIIYYREQQVCDGYRKYRNSIAQDWAAYHTTNTAVTDTLYSALQYIKLYEQSNDVTYRTPVSAILGTDNPVTRACLGYCIQSHSKGNHHELHPNSDPSKINGGKDGFDTTLPDYSAIGRSHPYDLNATITNFCTAKTISRQGLFKAPENNNLNQNLDNTTISDSIQFFNATVGPIYAQSINSDHFTNDDYRKSYGLDDNSRAYSYDIGLGGPCLLIKLAETEKGAKEKHTFANTSAAYTVQTHSGDFEALTSHTWSNNLLYQAHPRQPNSIKMDRNNSDNWYYYDYGGDGSEQNHLTDAYGTYDVQRIRINPNGSDRYGDYQPIFKNSIAGTMLCNIQQVPTIYNGTTHTDRELDTYYSYGDYHKAKTTGYDSAIVFNGDCYIQLLEYVSAHKYSNPADYYGSNDWWFLKTPLTRTTVYSIPVETNINIEYEYGHSISKTFNEGISNVSDIANPELEPYTMTPLKGSGANTVTQDTPMYQYNSVYSTNPTLRLFSVYTDDDANTSLQNYDCRCYYSNVKENNESVDSWLKFMSSNHLDVDTRYGGINKLRTFNNQLLFWQDSAFGVFSVNEQRLIQDASDQNLILGEGGVLQRYDYISTIYGMNKYQITDAHSDSRIYWFDHDNNTLLAYTQGSLAEISTTGNVRCYLSDVTKRYSDVKLVYDNEYSEVRANINVGESLVYNEDQSAFTAIYDSAKDPVWFIKLPTGILGITNGSIYKENARDRGIPGANKRCAYGQAITPKVTFISNNISNSVKVFDVTTFGGTFTDKANLTLSYTTPHNQKGETSDITDREWDYRVAIPRDGDTEYGHRLRDKTLTCTISSNDSVGKFSLEYVITKYRLSCS